MSDLDMVREDFLGLIEMDENEIGEQAYKNILKGTVKNFFDYLKAKLE